MKPIIRGSRSFLRAAFYGAATLAQAAEGAFNQGSPSGYEEVGAKLVCPGADKVIEGSEVFAMSLAKLTKSG